MMRIGLIDVDQTSFPNIALGKIARWAMRRELYASCDFKDYEPRKGFKCKEYFK